MRGCEPLNVKYIFQSTESEKPSFYGTISCVSQSTVIALCFAAVSTEFWVVFFVSGDGRRRARDYRDVPNTHAHEATHEIPAVCNLMVEGEAPQAVTSESLKEVHRTCTQMGASRGVLHCKLSGDVGGAVAMQWRE